LNKPDPRVVKTLVDLLQELRKDEVAGKYSIYFDRSLKSGCLSGKRRLEECGLKGWDRYSRLLALMAGKAGTLPVLQIGGGLSMSTLALAAGASGSGVILIEEREDSEKGRAGVSNETEPQTLSQADAAQEKGGERIAVCSPVKEVKIPGLDREYTCLPGNIEIRLVDSFGSQDINYIIKGSAGVILISANSSVHKLLYCFEMATGMVSEQTVVAVEDIHFSAETEAGWKEMKDDRRVSVSIDLLRYGLLFFRKNIAKQHFLIRY
jgi:hypothetical protein